MKLTGLFVTLIVLLAGLFAWGANSHPKEYFSDRCFANLTYDSSTKEEDFTFNGNIAFEFRTDKTGQFNLSGFMKSDGKTWTFSRYITFNYRNISANKYHITITGQAPMVHDNAPDNVSALAVKMLGLGGQYAVYLQRTDDNYFTIGIPLSPVINCVIQS